MPVVALAPLPKIQFFDNNGLPLALGKVYTYQTGTTTPLATYTDATGATPNANPVVLDASGRANIWIGPQAYTFSVTTASGTVLYTIDGISAQNMPIQAAIHFAAQAAPSAGAGDYYLWADSTGLRLKMVNNGTTDFVVGRDTTDTLTNKTLTSPTVTSPTISNPTLTGTSALATVTVSTSLKPTADATVPLGDATHRFNASLATVTAKLLNGSIYNVKEYGALGDGATDDSAAFQAANNAAAAAGGGVVYIPASSTTYDFATSLTMSANVILSGAGPFASILRWTGATNGTAISINGVNGCRVQDLTLRTAKAGTTIGILIKNCSYTELHNLRIHGSPTEFDATGFGTAIQLTGDGVSTYCNVTSMSHLYIRGWQTTGIAIDHTNGVFIDNTKLYQTIDSTTGTGLFVGTAGSAVYINKTEVLYGALGLSVSNGNEGGAYGGAPNWLFADQLIIDTITGGHGITFGSNLSSSVIGFSFSNSWASKCGLNTAGTIINAGSVGINHAGGKGITWSNGRVFSNSLSGFYIVGTSGGDIGIIGGMVGWNNQNNSAGQAGILVGDAVTNVRIIGVKSSNFGNATGHQKYGISVAAVNADQLIIKGCDLNGNETSAFNNGNTGVSTVSGNLPIGINGLANVDLTAQGAAIGTTTLYAVPANGAGQYRLMWDAKVTTPATTGAATSTLGALTIVYTDPDGVAQTITAPASIAAGTIATTSATNTTAAVLLGLPLTLNCKASTNITYAMAYASDTAGQMKYNLHIKLIEAL